MLKILLFTALLGFAGCATTQSVVTHPNNPSIKSVRTISKETLFQCYPKGCLIEASEFYLSVQKEYPQASLFLVHFPMKRTGTIHAVTVSQLNTGNWVVFDYNKGIVYLPSYASIENYDSFKKIISKKLGVIRPISRKFYHSSQTDLMEKHFFSTFKKYKPTTSVFTYKGEPLKTLTFNFNKYTVNYNFKLGSMLPPHVKEELLSTPLTFEYTGPKSEPIVISNIVPQ